MHIRHTLLNIVAHMHAGVDPSDQLTALITDYHKSIAQHHTAV